ncbi:MAG: response regulator transcription factor [Gammaproteobacteria bacterium]|nr:response regulator transcription factor [Gammaproteobacteria bacterium]
MQITLLEDDPAQAQMLIGWLDSAGHNVSHFDQGSSLLKALPRGGFDLLILDWELPDITGIEVLETVREEVKWHVPVLFVTQRDSESDIVKALSSGADDYMVKQTSQGEFLARVNALGRRLAAEELEFEVGPFRFLPETQSVTRNGEEVELTAKDFELAWYLFRNVGRLLSREQLLRDVWKVSGLATRTVDVHMSRIRKRMQLTPESGYRIKTIYQHGYRLEAL